MKQQVFIPQTLKTKTQKSQSLRTVDTLALMYGSDISIILRSGTG